VSDRERILAALRRQPPPAGEMPHPGASRRCADATARFATVLGSVGGTCQRVADPGAIPAHLAALPAWEGATRVFSAIAEVPCRGVGASVAAHAAASLDCALLRARFAVAENAAVWVDAVDVPHRALFFLPQHVGLLVAASAVVQDMHEAYARLSFGERGFGCFISGPSKTADIEQALVIGAHGPRSLIVFLVGDKGSGEEAHGQ
jgi:L-lactate dehydrogenase complex protein LldG